MSGLFSLFQIAGAKSFNEFLGGGGERNQRNKRRSLKKTFRERSQRRSSRRTNRKTNRRSSRRTNRRTNRRTDRRTNRRTNRRTDRRTNRRTDRRTNRRTDRRTNRRTDRITDRRTNRRTNRKPNRIVKGRTLSKRKHIGSKGKYHCSNGCKGHSKRGYFKGTEPSPKGLGYCAHCIPLNVIMKGNDGKLWENQKYSKGKRWVKV
jgi:hypothetical protein